MVVYVWHFEVGFREFWLWKCDRLEVVPVGGGHRWRAEGDGGAWSEAVILTARRGVAQGGLEKEVAGWPSVSVSERARLAQW